MSIVSSILTYIMLAIYEPLGVCVYTIPLKKRPQHKFLGFIAVILYYVLIFVFNYYEVPWGIQLILKFAALSGIAYSIVDCSNYDCMYLAVWANTTHMLLFNIILSLEFSNALAFLKITNFLIRYTPIYVIGYIIAYFTLAKKICVGEKLNIEKKHIIMAILTVLPFNIFNNMLVSSSLYEGPSLMSMYCCTFSFLCCIFVLYLQRTTVINAQLHHDYNLMQQLLNQRQLQYQISKENIDIINQKCHDLKHQIDMLTHLPSAASRSAYIKEVNKSIMFYDSVFRTGNEVLDTLLTEKSLYCLKHDITIKCIADGKCLDFIDPVDLYSLLGNAIDNAFESLYTVEDKDLRMINIYVRKELNFVTICIENYCKDEPEFVDGIPLTTKHDKHNHGFGIKSMQYTANKYSGQMTVNVENSMFIVRFLFPR